ncbi:unnamed protein product [Amoebophrya sp. A120]|nr:unnamed protein product [Amoebophrya sp. A120]|eukprot:GSA120T00012420001.1
MQMLQQIFRQQDHAGSSPTASATVVQQQQQSRGRTRHRAGDATETTHQTQPDLLQNTTVIISSGRPANVPPINFGETTNVSSGATGSVSKGDHAVLHHQNNNPTNSEDELDSFVQLTPPGGDFGGTHYEKITTTSSYVPAGAGSSTTLSNTPPFPGAAPLTFGSVLKSSSNEINAQVTPTSNGSSSVAAYYTGAGSVPAGGGGGAPGTSSNVAMKDYYNGSSATSTPTNARTVKQDHVIISKSIRTVSLSPQNRGPSIVNRTTPLHVMNNSTSVSGLSNNAGQILPLQQQDPGFFHPRRANAFAQEAVERLRSASLEQNRKWMPPTVPAAVSRTGDGRLMVNSSLATPIMPITGPAGGKIKSVSFLRVGGEQQVVEAVAQQEPMAMAGAAGAGAPVTRSNIKGAPAAGKNSNMLRVAPVSPEGEQQGPLIISSGEEPQQPELDLQRAARAAPGGTTVGAQHMKQQPLAGRVPSPMLVRRGNHVSPTELEQAHNTQYMMQQKITQPGLVAVGASSSTSAPAPSQDLYQQHAEFMKMKADTATAAAGSALRQNYYSGAPTGGAAVPSSKINAAPSSSTVGGTRVENNKETFEVVDQQLLRQEKLMQEKVKHQVNNYSRTTEVVEAQLREESLLLQKQKEQYLSQLELELKNRESDVKLLQTRLQEQEIEKQKLQQNAQKEMENLEREVQQMNKVLAMQKMNTTAAAVDERERNVEKELRQQETTALEQQEQALKADFDKSLKERLQEQKKQLEQAFFMELNNNEQASLAVRKDFERQFLELARKIEDLEQKEQKQKQLAEDYEEEVTRRQIELEKAYKNVDLANQMYLSQKETADQLGEQLARQKKQLEVEKQLHAKQLQQLEEKRKEDFSSDVQEKEAYLQQKEQELQDSKDMFEQLVEKVSEERFAKEKQRLVTEIEHLEKIDQAAEKEINRLKERERDLFKKQQNQQNHLESLKEERVARKEALRLVQLELDETKEQLKKAMKKQNEQNLHESAHNQEQFYLKEKITSLEDLLEELKQEKLQQAEEVNQLKHQLKQKQMEITDIQGKQKASESTLETLKQEMRKREQDLEQLLLEYAEAAQLADRKCKEVEQKFQEYKETAALDYEKMKNQASTELEQYKRQANIDYEQLKADHESAYERLMNKKNELEFKLAKLLQELLEKDQDLTKTRKDLENKQEELDVLDYNKTAEVHQLEYEKRELQQEVENLKSKIEQMKESFKSTEVELAQSQLDLREMQFKHQEQNWRGRVSTGNMVASGKNLNLFDPSGGDENAGGTGLFGRNEQSGVTSHELELQQQAYVENHLKQLMSELESRAAVILDLRVQLQQAQEKVNSFPTTTSPNSAASSSATGGGNTGRGGGDALSDDPNSINHEARCLVLERTNTELQTQLSELRDVLAYERANFEKREKQIRMGAANTSRPGSSSGRQNIGGSIFELGPDGSLLATEEYVE